MDKGKGHGLMDNMDIQFHYFDLETHWMIDQEKRLDARFYDKDVIAARVIIEKLEKKNIEIKPVKNLSEDVFWPGRFKRKYVSKDAGEPFIMPSEAFMFLFKPKKFVTDYPDNVSIGKNWILITRSGSVGRALISTDLLKEKVLSDDLIRIKPKNGESFGYLYAYLNTWMGKAFLVKDQYGATVKHIEPHHVSAIPVPIIQDLIKKINEKIKKAHKLREEAQSSLIRAGEMIYSELGLKKFRDDEAKYYGGEEGRLIRCFELKAKNLSLRLDASYHTPILRIIKNNLSKAKFKVSVLGNVIDDIFIPTRFKRSYVKNPEEGIPFLQGSHIPQIKPLDVKYLWKKTKKIDNKKLKRNWVLMTRSGTVGRVGIVRDEWDGWAASEHVLRIVIKNEIHPGFVYAFLSNPYGEYQIKGIIYGAVVDEIGEQDTSLIEDIELILPTKEVQDEIGEIVFKAWDKKDMANQIESETINLLEQELLKEAEEEIYDYWKSSS